MITIDQRLGASWLYQVAITRPWTCHAQRCHYISLLSDYISKYYPNRPMQNDPAPLKLYYNIWTEVSRSNHRPASITNSSNYWYWVRKATIFLSHSFSHLEFSTGRGDPPAVWFWTANNVRFGSWTVQTPTSCVLSGQTRTRTSQPTGFAGFGSTCQFQSPVLCFRFFFFWSHLDIQPLMTICELW